jgi:hypothetical protein
MPISASLLHRAAQADSARDCLSLLPQALLPAGCGFAPFVRHGKTVQAPAVTLLNRQLMHPPELDTWLSVHEGAQTTTCWKVITGQPESLFFLVVSASGSLNLQVPIMFRLPADHQILEAIVTAGALGIAVELIEFGHSRSTPILWVEPVVAGLRAQLRLPRMAGVRTRDRAWSRSSSKELI